MGEFRKRDDILPHKLVTAAQAIVDQFFTKQTYLRVACSLFFPTFLCSNLQIWKLNLSFCSALKSRLTGFYCVMIQTIFLFLGTVKQGCLAYIVVWCSNQITSGRVDGQIGMRLTAQSGWCRQWYNGFSCNCTGCYTIRNMWMQTRGFLTVSLRLTECFIPWTLRVPNMQPIM